MGEIVRKRVPFPGDTGVETAFATNVNGTVVAVAVADLAASGALTFSVVPDRASDTGVVWAVAARSTDTGYDPLQATEQPTCAGDRIKVAHDGASGGGTVYLYVNKP